MNLTKDQQYLCFGIVLFFLTGIVAVYWQSVEKSRQSTRIPATHVVRPTADSGQTSVGSILVHIDGAVIKRGVYRFPPGTRIMDAVKVAIPDKIADLTQLNLAAPIQDGMTLRVPEREMGGSNTNGGKSAAIHLNRASESEVDQIPGIGKTLASRIVDYRKAHGLFLVVEDLLKVPGIGKKLFNRIKEYVRI